MVVSHRGGRQRGVQAPGAEALGQRRSCGDLGCDPVVVGGVAGVEGVVEGLHEAVEVGAEAGGLPEVAGRVDQMSLALSPFCSTVLEPDLQMANKRKRSQKLKQKPSPILFFDTSYLNTFAAPHL